MSQQPKSQPPLNPKPEAGQSETTLEKETQSQDQNQIQAVLKTQSIKALRGTIGVLEGVLEKLEAKPAAGTLPPTGETSSFLHKLQIWWSAALANIRSLLPESLNQKLSNTALTSIVAGMAVIIVWTTSVLLPGKPTEVANVPPSEQVPPAIITNVPASEQVPLANITTPPELTAPAEPQPIEIAPQPEPMPTPSPTLELTPEQNLIASIEKQVAEITDRFADGLIQSIQTNFQNSSLTIKVGDDWYNLQQLQQDKLAARMLERAKGLDFSHLELIDPEGILLARSPVVGTDMVILKRQVLNDQDSAVKTPAG